MLKRITVAASVVFCLAGLARVASAQDDSGKFRPFNGLFADLFSDDTKPAQKHPLQHKVSQDYTVPNYSTAGNQTQRAPAQAQSPASAATPLPNPPADPPRGIDYDASTRSEGMALPPRRSDTNDNYSFQWNDSSSPGKPPQAPSSAGISAGEDHAATADSVPRGPLAIHERLKQFRQSPFGDAPEAAPTASEPPSVVRQDLPAAGPALVGTGSGSQSLPAPPSLPMASDPPSAHAGAPASGPRPASPQPVRAEPQPAATAAPGADVVQEPSVLMDHKSPQLSVETIGPRRIVVGKEAAYEVVLQNSGEQAAEDVAVTIGLPDWAEVAGTSVSTGDIVASADRSIPCRWSLHRIEAHSKEKLTLKIIPRQSKPFELAVHWDFKQSPSQALIEVQEPKLTMRLDGPREVLFGKKELYQLKLGNSGNGPAENVTLTLMPLTAGDTQPLVHRLGTIAAGDSRTIEVELTARQSGKVVIRVEANGDGGAHVDLAENVLVHRGALQVEVDGPAVQFVGTPAVYSVVVRNTGDAAARNVKVAAKLPTGMKLIAGSDGAKADTATDGGKVHWILERLEPGERRTLQMKCALGVSGLNRLEVASAADDDLAATAAAVTRAEATADLRLEIKEPDGPVPVGAEASYELHIRNRGTKAAENVEVLAYFSQGVEPFAATGYANHMTPGQVVFDSIPAIAPATELVLTVKAKAQAAGNHVFRAEVHCKSAGMRLVREEMTRYYQDGPNAQTAVAGNGSEDQRDEQRTADRYAPMTLPQQMPDQPSPTPAIKR